MNIKKIYRNLSDKFILDFENSSEINHNGNIGEYREKSLKEFLENGRLPRRYAIGNGEIISSVSGVSKQSDLIIYDSVEGLSFEGKDNLKIFPIESVCGIIEVKSCLSKEKLLEGLENIKSVKKLRINSVIEESKGGLTFSYRRPKPFGIIFAYKLSNNSLESLRNNIKEWESKNDAEYYPNLVVVLNQGILIHLNNHLNDCIYNNSLTKNCIISEIHLGKDSLFKFYSILIDLCSKSRAGNFNLMDYFDPSFFVGDLIVKNHNRFLRTLSEDNNVYKLKDEFIYEVYNWCQKNGKTTAREFYIQCIGGIPQGIDEMSLNNEVYLYNPQHLPPNDNKYEQINGHIQKANTGTLSPAHYLIINEEVYYIPMNYINETLIDIEPDITPDLL